MLGMGKRYRVVLRGDGGVRAWSVQTRSQALARFGQQVTAGGFSPWDERRLMVMSEEEWVRLGGPELVAAGGGEELVGASVGAGPDGTGRSSGSGGSRRLFGWLSRGK